MAGVDACPHPVCCGSHPSPSRGEGKWQKLVLPSPTHGRGAGGEGNLLPFSVAMEKGPGDEAQPHAHQAYFGIASTVRSLWAVVGG